VRGSPRSLVASRTPRRRSESVACFGSSHVALKSRVARGMAMRAKSHKSCLPYQVEVRVYIRIDIKYCVFSCVGAAAVVISHIDEYVRLWWQAEPRLLRPACSVALGVIVIICSCNVLSDAKVRASLQSETAPRTPGAVYRCLGCSPNCGRCLATVRSIISEALNESQNSADTSTCCKTVNVLP